MTVRPILLLGDPPLHDILIYIHVDGILATSRARDGHSFALRSQKAG